MSRCFVAVRRFEHKLWVEQYQSCDYDKHGYPPWLLKRY